VRTRSPATAFAAIVDVSGRAVAGERWNQRAPWYLGALGLIVRTDGLRIEVPSRYLAGVLRLGGFEIYERELVVQHLPRELPLIEIGGGLGLVSCLANRRLANPRAHICIEANPHITTLLQRNRDRNGCQFSIISAALAYDATEVTLGVDDNIAESAVGDIARPSVTVKAVRLADVLETAQFERFSLICDIEGAEQALFREEGDLLRERAETIMIEVHPHIYGKDGVQSLHNRLDALGFELCVSKSDVWIAKSRQLAP
jgi:FkbM family methyltransferase